AYHRRREGTKGFFADFDRAGDVEFNMSHKDCEIFHKLRSLWQGVLIKPARKYKLRRYRLSRFTGFLSAPAQSNSEGLRFTSANCRPPKNSRDLFQRAPNLLG